jgi:hypothetical protein
MTLIAQRHAPDYADIPVKIRAYMEEPATFIGSIPSNLLTVLGCPHGSESDARAQVIPDIHLEHQVVIGDALLVLLSHVASRLGTHAWEAASILGGLYMSGAWKRCVVSDSTSYHLAAVALYHIQTFSPYDELDMTTRPVVCRLLNEWLQPPVSWKILPDVRTLAVHFFGEIWWTLREPAPEDFASDIVNRERPPFMPGLCLEQNPSFDTVLPDMGLAS